MQQLKQSEALLETLPHLEQVLLCIAHIQQVRLLPFRVQRVVDHFAAHSAGSAGDDCIGVRGSRDLRRKGKNVFVS